ncbi:MAG TPA: serine hydrolase, partial [Bacteroidales bacterium]
TATMVGIALDEGYINNINEKVLSFFPKLQIENNDSLKKLITIKHLLTMTSGLEWLEWKGGDDVNMFQSNKVNWIPYILNKKMVYTPGDSFCYNSGVPFILSAIVSMQTGMPTNEYAKQKLFKPIGIDSVNWERKSPEGITTGGWGSYFKLADMARIGYLYLKKGKWKDKQIVPEAWIREATRKQVEVKEEDDDYGYQCWIIKEFPKAAYAARGWYGTHYAYVIVIPDENLLIAMAGEVDYYKAKRLIKRYIFNVKQ